MADPVVVSLTASSARAPDLETAYVGLFALGLRRQRTGRLLLVLDDEGADGPGETEVLRDLRWVGLDWDAAPVRRSEHRGFREEARHALGAEADAAPTVVDDHTLGLTHAIRSGACGDEERLHRRLGWSPPAYVVLARLPDRVRSIPLFRYRERGYRPGALLQWLGWLGSASTPVDGALSLPALLERIDLRRLRSDRAPAERAELDRLQGLHVRRLHEALVPAGRTDTNTAALLRHVRESLVRAESCRARELEAVLQTLAREAGWAEEELQGTVGRAVNGGEDPTDLPATLASLGRAACIERLDAAIDVLGSPENPILGTNRRQA